MYVSTPRGAVLSDGIPNTTRETTNAGNDWWCFSHLGAAVPIIVLPLHGDLHAGGDIPVGVKHGVKRGNFQRGVLWSCKLRRNGSVRNTMETKRKKSYTVFLLFHPVRPSPCSVRFVELKYSREQHQRMHPSVDCIFPETCTLLRNLAYI